MLLLCQGQYAAPSVGAPWVLLLCHGQDAAPSAGGPRVLLLRKPWFHTSRQAVGAAAAQAEVPHVACMCYLAACTMHSTMLRKLAEPCGSCQTITQPCCP